MIAAIGALLGVRFVMDGARHGDDARLHGFAGAFGVVTLILFAALHGAPAWNERHCDAVGPAWFGPLTVAPIILLALLPLAAPHGPIARAGLLLLAASAGIGVLAATAPLCLGGPFVKLDPLVRTMWYDNVLEGMPVWRQPANIILVLICFPLVGIAGALSARAAAATVAVRRNWTTVLLLMLAAFAVSLFVQREGALAHGYALPGAAALLRGLTGAIARWKRMPVRVLASAAVLFLVTPIGITRIAEVILAGINREGDAATSAARGPCVSPCDRFGALNRLPPAYILSALDIAPRALVNTHHRFAGGGYHRNAAAIHRVLAAFLSPPESARRTMASTGMDYVLIDPTGGETELYVRAAPHGLMARLLRGEAPAWLQPVPLERSTLKLWRRIR